ncbi:hypothetical protein BDN72DRAFT_905705 [Pluteus cervinus]|uniref:Uncharacterized protein n=1 Tax=Pluteus cervinus TaxID=181527 RepID=A0ACD3A222_9AGAR|nr:hypothetical protein BDN72DRAFT_905705 [Pluteus cervinus]
MPQPPNPEAGDFEPFDRRAQFEFGEFIYVQDEMSAGKVDRLMNHLYSLYPNDDPPFADHKELHALIDGIKHGDVPWDSFTVKYNGPRPAGDSPTWMDQGYEVWFRDPLQVLENQIANPEFKGKMDYAPKVVTKEGKRRYKNMMSGKWAWKKADEISTDPDCHGAMLAPVILGSDKTTVSVATGQNDFYPLYASLGNLHNSVRRAHKNSVVLIGFLAMPKTSKEYADKADFRKFRRQLFHTSLEYILSSLRPHMSKPRLTYCGDGYYRKVIYRLGPYIADYPEQALLACIVQGWCPKCTAPPDDLDRPGEKRRSHIRTEALQECCSLTELWDDFGIVGDLVPFTTSFPGADIHELLSPDLLHQIIKGTFKDHLVDWVEQYINATNPPRVAKEIQADIDRRIAAVPPFPGLRNFHEGRGFKQWTGNDSKGLMKVYLPAIAGHLPDKMVQAISDLIEFCYLVRRDIIDDDTLVAISATLDRFHVHREAFRDVRPDGFSLPRQHSLMHYHRSIQLFGAPNGLCSSITENKHIKAVKRPYRRSGKFKPLGYMLVTNQRIDKIATARTYYTSKGLMNGPGIPLHLLAGIPVPPPPPPPPPLPDDDERIEMGAVEEPISQSEVKLAKTHVRSIPNTLYGLAQHVEEPKLLELTQRYLYDILYPDAAVSGSQAAFDQLPIIMGLARMYTSARAVFYAPSDLSGIGGMHHERIRATASWYRGPPRYDCVFIGDTDSEEPGFWGFHVARVRLFFSFKHGDTTYPCALIHWFSPIGYDADWVTGMWRIKPDYHQDGTPVLGVVSVDAIYRGAHLIGCAGDEFLPKDFDKSESLDSFKSFYVNKYADHHAHEIAF